MSDTTFTRRINIYIESGQAAAAGEVLIANQEKLNQKLETTKQKLKEAADKYAANPTKKHGEEVKKLGETYAATQKSIEQNTAALDRQNKKISGEISPSLKDLTGTVNRLKRELSTMSEQDAGFSAKVLEYNKAKAALDKYSGSLITVKEGLKNMLKEARGVAVGVLVGSTVQAAVQSAIAGIGNIGNIRNEFEGKVRNLSAITGATGADLDYLKQKAIDFSTQSTKSASDFVEAMKLIGSAKPELLQDAAALAEVTRQADRLAKASGLDLPDAATRLTDALNQYGADASEAAHYVDILAAAAKYGAAEVPQITEALLEFGPVAKQSKISIQESAEAIELLAEKGLKGAEAGTKLRNVFLTMSAVESLPKEALLQLEKYGVNTEILQDKTKSLAARLKELSKIQGDANAMMAVFDKQNVVAGSIMLQNIPRYAQLAEQVNEVGVASQQAAQNTATFTSAWGKFTNTLTAFVLNIPTGGLTKMVQAMTSLISKAETATEAYNKQKESVTNLNSSTIPMIARYEELTGKASLNKDEQDELNTIIEKIAKTIPTAISEFDKYGKALGINTGKAKEFIEQQQNMLAIQNSAAITESERNLKIVENNISSLQHSLARGGADIAHNEGMGQVTYHFAKFTGEQIRQTQANLADLQKQADGYRGILKELQGANPSGPQATDIPDAASTSFSPLLSAEQKQEQFNQLKTVSEEKKKAAEKALKEKQDFLKEIEKLENESYLASLSANEKEIVAVTQKYDELKVRAKKYGIDATRIETDMWTELHALTEKQAGSDADAAYRLKVKGLEEIFAQAKQVTKQDYANGIIDKEQYNEKIKALDVALLKAKADLATKEKGESKAAADEELNAIAAAKDAELNLVIQTEEQKNAVKKKYSDESSAMLAKKTAEDNQLIQAGIQFTTSALQGLGQIMSNLENGELARDKKLQAEKAEHFKKQLDSRQISQKQYEIAIDHLNKEGDKKAHEIAVKQFKRNQALQIVTTIINTAAAVVSALGTSGNIYAGIALAAMAAATGAVQIGVIASEKAPEFGTGNESWRMGIGGDRHSDNSRGNPIIDPDTGKILGKVERGEAFIPVDSTEANQPAISWMLANRGKPLPNFNFGRAMENVRYETGTLNYGKDAAFGRAFVNRSEAGGDGGHGTSIGITDIIVIERKDRQRQHDELVAILKENRSVVFQKDAYDRFNNKLNLTFTKQL